MLGLGQSCGSVTEVGFHNQGSINFDGTNDYVQIDALAGVMNELFDATSPPEVNISVSAWVKLETMSSSGIIFNMRAGTSTSNQINLFWHGSDNRIKWNIKLANSASACDDNGSGSFTASGIAENDGNWYHIVGTMTHGDVCELWINGVKRDSVAQESELNEDFTVANIGTNTQETAFWNGNIDEVAVWSRCLSDTEILHLSRYHNIDLSDASGLGRELKAYYRFEEKSGTIANNTVDPNTNGTLTNSPTYSLDVAS